LVSMIGFGIKTTLDLATTVLDGGSALHTELGT
jgi:hypothetical protein